MIKRALYVGLGMTILVAKKATSLVCAGSRFLTGHPEATVVVEEVTIGNNGQHPAAADVLASAPAQVKAMQGGKPDDLTEIKGIGPTYAKRLQEAGITTFAALATQSPDRLLEITKATSNQADPIEWIAEARALASFFSLE